MSASTNPNESSQMTAPSGGGGGSSGGVPDLMKIGSIPVNTVQEVETAILEPVIHLPDLFFQIKVFFIPILRLRLD